MQRLSHPGGGAASEVAEEVTEEIAEEVAEEIAEEIAEEALEEVAEEAVEEALEEGAEEVAEEVAEETTEEVAEETVEQSAEALKEAELPIAMGEAITLTETNDLLGTPVVATVYALNMTVKPRYSWLKYFEARPKGPHRYSVHMIASDHVVDANYTEETPEGETVTPTTENANLLDEGGTFRDTELEARYQRYRQQKIRQGIQADEVRDRLEWKEASDFWANSPMGQGNAFNRERDPFYVFNEIYVENPAGGYYRLDSYVPGEEIVSRKFTQLGDVTEQTALRYIYEIGDKYPAGAVIAHVPSNSVGGANADIFDHGSNHLSGDLFLEVPVQNGPVPQSILDAATREGVFIRDTAWHIYNP